MKVSQEILSLVPYKAGKPISETQREYGITRVIKLASNENPLGPSPKVLEALRTALAHIHRYPDPACHDLRHDLAAKWSLEAKNIAIGNGSNEIIDILIRIYCEPKDEILTTQMAFIAYQICAQAARVTTRFAPLKENYHIDLSAMSQILQADVSKKIKLVFIPNPNNPTGTYVNENEVLSFLQKHGSDPDRLIVFDEAYHEYVRAKDYRSAQELQKNFPSVVVVRTLSKAYGLAGLRIGVLVAQESVIDLYNRVRNPFNVNELAQVAARAALQDDEYVKKAVSINSTGLDFFYAELKKLGLNYIESQANFVLVDMKRDVRQLNEALLKKGVILRPVSNYGLKSLLRISVGLPEENQIAIQALKEVIKG